MKKTIVYTLSRDGHDIGELPFLENGNWDKMWNDLMKAVKATGKAGRWYLYRIEKWWDDCETYRETTVKMEQFVEIH